MLGRRLDSTALLRLPFLISCQPAASDNTANPAFPPAPPPPHHPHLPPQGNLVDWPALQRYTYKRIGFPIPYLIAGKWGFLPLPVKTGLR